MAAAAAVEAPKPRSPPKYPDFSGRRRLQLELQTLNRELGFLQEELHSLEGLQPVSRCCKEVNEFVGTNPDPLIPVIKKKRGSCYILKWIRSKLCSPFSWICCCTGYCEQHKSCTCCSCTCLKSLCCCSCGGDCLSCCYPDMSCCRLPTCTCCKGTSCCALLTCCCPWNLFQCCSCNCNCNCIGTSCCQLPTCTCCQLPTCACCKGASCCALLTCCCPWNLFRCRSCNGGASCCKNRRCCLCPSCSCPEYSCGCVLDCPKCTGV